MKTIDYIFYLLAWCFFVAGSVTDNFHSMLTGIMIAVIFKLNIIEKKLDKK